VYPLYDDWLERLMAPFSEPTVALVYGRQRGDENSRFSERQIFRSWFPGRSDPNQGHPFCNNANAAIRRSVWERIPYDETLTGLEDLAWAGQAMSMGYRILYDAAAEIVHVHDETWNQILNRYRREAIAMKKLHPEIRFRLGDFLRLTVLNVCNDLRAAVREGKALRYAQEIILFRTMQFWGAFRGYSQHGPVSRHLWMRFYYPGENELEDSSSREAGRIDYEALHR
jgi:GT2 family glycosyltransferase